MSRKTKLIASGVIAGCITAAVVAFQWNSLVQTEEWFWVDSGKPDTANNYVQFASNAGEGSILERIMSHSSTMQEHLKQRKREADTYQASLPTDADLRKKMREDYVNSAKTLHLEPAMTTSMLALIEDANERRAEIPYSLTVTNNVAVAGDHDLELVLGTNVNGAPWLEHCQMDFRRDAQHLPFGSSTGIEQSGVSITISLKDVPEMMVLGEKFRDGSTSEQKVRSLGATVEMNVVPPHGTPVHAARDINLEGFQVSRKVRVDPITRQQLDFISLFDIYTEEVHTLADKACFAADAMIGTTDVPYGRN